MLWEQHKDKQGTQQPSHEWTDKNHHQLEKAKSGDISCIERTHLMRRAVKLKGEFLSTMLWTLPKDELFNVITCAVCERSDAEKDELATKLLQSDGIKDLFYCDSSEDDVPCLCLMWNHCWLLMMTRKTTTGAFLMLLMVQILSACIQMMKAGRHKERMLKQAHHHPRHPCHPNRCRHDPNHCLN
jgi:hypothetical protein